MRTMTWAIAGVLLVGAASAQEPRRDAGDEADRLRARVEMAEVAHELDKTLFKEALSQLRRAERSRQVDRGEMRPREADLDPLRDYVEKEQRRLEEQAMALAKLKRDATAASRRPVPAPTRPRVDDR